MKHFTLILLFIGISLNFAFAQKSEKPFWATSEYHIELKNSYIETIIVTTEVVCIGGIIVVVSALCRKKYESGFS